MVNFMVIFMCILCSCDIKLMVNNKLYNQLIMLCVMLITVRLIEYGKLRK